MSSNTGNVTITSTPIYRKITWNPKTNYLTPRQHLFLIRMKRYFDSPIKRGKDFRFSLGLNGAGQPDWAWRKGRDISEFLEEISSGGCYNESERDILNGIRSLWMGIGS